MLLGIVKGCVEVDKWRAACCMMLHSLMTILDSITTTVVHASRINNHGIFDACVLDALIAITDCSEAACKGIGMTCCDTRVLLLCYQRIFISMCFVVRGGSNEAMSPCMLGGGADWCGGDGALGGGWW